MKAELQSLFLKMLDAQQPVINSLCAVYYQSAQDRQDAKQDIILQLWKAWPGFRQEAKVSTWVYRVALNTLLNKKRKEATRPSGNSVSDLPEHLLISGAQADDHVQLLKQLIYLLDDLDKALLVLHLEGYQHKEIGQILDTSATNVSTRLNRIKLKLKKYHQKSDHATR